MQLRESCLEEIHPGEVLLHQKQRKILCSCSHHVTQKSTAFLNQPYSQHKKDYYVGLLPMLNWKSIRTALVAECTHWKKIPSNTALKVWNVMSVVLA